MTYRIFQYPIPAPPELPDLNAWLTSQRIVSVQHHLVAQPAGAMLVFVVQSTEGATSAGGEVKRARIDYRKVLDPETFARFSFLRDERKKIGSEQGVPVYTLFTNEQLAAMAKPDPADLASWALIDGVGSERIEKYGERMLASLQKTETES